MSRKLIYFFIVIILAASAFAQEEIGKNHDGSAPIEITSDSLEILQTENKAIFSGDVQAKQGELDIRSEKMTVYYKADKAHKNKAKEAPKTKNANSASKVIKVEINQNVFISTPKETAKGSRGVYDVEAKTLVLEGDVTLTSMKNIVKGNKLVYNLATGQSRLISGSGENIGGKKERVRGVFVPNG